MLHIIYNPHSGRGKLRCREMTYDLEKAGISYRLHLAMDESEDRLLSQELSPDHKDVILLIGGDGSLNHLINLLPDQNPPALMLLPSGSGNDFSRGLGMRRGIRSVIRILTDKRRLRPCFLDCGEASYGETKRRFIVSCGLGYDAWVCRTINGSPLKKRLNQMHLSRLSYLIHGIQGIFRYEPAEVSISIDGGSSHVISDVAFISCHNLPCEGGGFAFAPAASARDGKLDITVFRAKNRAVFTMTLAASIFRLHTRLPNVLTASCKMASFKADRPLPFHTDGEVDRETDAFTVQIHPKAIPFLYMTETR